MEHSFSSSSMQRTSSVEEFIPGFKVKFAEKKHDPAALPTYDHMSASIVVNAMHILEEPSIVIGEKGRRRFPPMYSTVQESKGGKRHITPPKRSNTPPRGKRYIPHHQSSGEINMQSKKHLFDASMKRSDSTDLPKVGWTKKGRVMDETGVPAGQKESEVYQLESTMNRKQRIVADIDKRNGIPTAKSGDLPFRASEQASGFFESGGLIPGSTNVLRQSAKPTMKKNENSSAQVATKKLEATYGKMKARLELDYDVAQVKSLTVSLLLVIRCL